MLVYFSIFIDIMIIIYILFIYIIDIDIGELAGPKRVIRPGDEYLSVQNEDSH